jgi:hypothetical protein
MDRETVARYTAFVDELQKEAAIIPEIGKAVSKIPLIGPHAVSMLRKGLKDRFGRQLLAGAALGGGTGYLASDDEHKIRNTLIGAGVGAGAAGTRILVSPTLRSELGSQLKRGGQRLRYQFTGHGLGETPAARLEEAKRLKLIEEAPKAPDLSGTISMKARTKSEQAHLKALEHHKGEIEALERGEYSAPGVFHSALSHPGQFFKNQWKRNDNLSKFFAGYGTLATGKSLIEKPEEGGPGRFEKSLNIGGQTAGWLASPRGFMPGMLVAPVVGKVGKTVGRGIDTVLGTRRPAPTPIEPQISTTGGI